MAADQVRRRASWTVIDQAVVSAGGFLTQVLLARTLPAADYGSFGLVFGALLTLQLFNATLIFYPLTVCLPAAREADRAALLGATVMLASALTVILTLVAMLGLVLFGRPDLGLVVAGFFLARQAHEVLRRGLFAEFRHRAALPGDALAHLLPILGLLWLNQAGGASIEAGFTVMAGAAVLGALVHAARLTIAPAGLPVLRKLTHRYWRIGGWRSLGSSLLTSAPYLILPWSLAYHAGAAAVAPFQAAMNIVNMANPLHLAIGNVIPQATASAAAQGGRAAWGAAKAYGRLAAPLLLAYTLAIWAAPELVLRLLYSSAPDYAGLGQEVRLLVLVASVGFAVEFLLAFLGGMAEMHRGVVVNAAGTLTATILAVPLIAAFGLLGGCVALLLTNLIRLGVAALMARQVIGRPAQAFPWPPQTAPAPASPQAR